MPACDDSLIQIFQSANPEERFTSQMGRLIAQVKTLGELINRCDYQKSREHLLGLMQMWLEFDNGYLVQPPFPVADISVWRGQSARIAERIGAIHAKFRENRFDRVHPDLDFLVTDLTDLYAQNVAQKPLFRVLIRLDALAAGLNPALENTTRIASSAALFAEALGEWGTLDSDPAHLREFEELRLAAQQLAATGAPGDLLRRNELCERVRNSYETLKRRFILSGTAR
ncbi:MAG TPA: hypothetical protein PLP29_12160 [Candidatus Ozemobacteraceae bacterium]|nr:hypothetical protein [Candidatus Ozemobacteraceae bacterium]